MAINFIPNDPLAGSKAPPLRRKTPRANRPASRAGLTSTIPSPSGHTRRAPPAFSIGSAAKRPSPRSRRGRATTARSRSGGRASGSTSTRTPSPSWSRARPERVLRPRRIPVLRVRRRDEDDVLRREHGRGLARDRPRPARLHAHGPLVIWRDPGAALAGGTSAACWSGWGGYPGQGSPRPRVPQAKGPPMIVSPRGGQGPWGHPCGRLRPVRPW